MVKKPAIYEFGKAFWIENPIFVQILGTCPTLAVSTSVVNGLAMGLATTFVLLFSTVITSAIRKIVPNEVRIAIFTIIIALFVTVADMFLKAYFPPLSKALGPYVPLIVVNCIIFGRIEAFSAKNTVFKSFLDGLGNGFAFTVSIMFMGAIRELLGNGTIFGSIAIQKFMLDTVKYKTMLVMILPAGAFITYGLLMAAVNSLKKVKV